MPRPVCVKCQVEYRSEKNGIVLEEVASFGSYRLWSADLWKCPECGHELISGYGKEPYGEHYELDYPQKRLAAQKNGLYHCFEVEPMPEAV